MSLSRYYDIVYLQTVYYDRFIINSTIWFIKLIGKIDLKIIENPLYQK